MIDRRTFCTITTAALALLPIGAPFAELALLPQKKPPAFRNVDIYRYDAALGSGHWVNDLDFTELRYGDVWRMSHDRETILFALSDPEPRDDVPGNHSIVARRVSYEDQSTGGFEEPP